MYKYILILILFVSSVCVVSAQVPVIGENEINRELQKQGVDDTEVKKRLQSRGIDVNNIDASDTQELQKLQNALEDIQREIEEERKAIDEAAENVAEKNVEEALENQAKINVTEVVESVDDGTSLKEAISEELIDQVEDGPKSKIYGQQIFRDKSIQVYRQTDNIRAPDSYILGPGDVVTISIWGPSQFTGTFEINKAGFIHPQDMSRIVLKGISFAKVKALLEQRFSQYYRFRPDEFEITLNYSRTINVNILGEAMNYGTFTIPAINTALNALVAAGGPTNIGSVRNITVRRNGTSKRLDVYEFMLENPSIQYDFYLEDNDIIYIPVAERIVKISGAVKRPFKYELIAGEQLKKLIDFSGGFTDNAFQSNLQVKRFVNDEEVIIDLNYRELQSRDFELLGGDEVVVNTIPKPYKNFVEISGAVVNAGKFEATTGMRISDLLRKGELVEGARTDVAFLIRTNYDNTIDYLRLNLDNAIANPNSDSNIELKPSDRIRILAKAAFVDNKMIKVDGAVRNPGSFPFDESQKLKIEDAIILSGGVSAGAMDFCYIKRTDPANQRATEYIRVNLKEALENPTSSSNLTLNPDDELIVYSYKRFTDESFIKVDGSVRVPGDYKYDISLTLKDALTLSGGLKLHAARSRIDISRIQFEGDQETKTIVATVEVDEDLNVVGGDTGFELEPFDQIYVRSAPEFELQQNIRIQGEVKYPGTYSLIKSNEKISSVIARAGGLTEEAFLAGCTLYRVKAGVGYIILDMKEALESTDNPYNYILQEGDVLQIPKQRDFVIISGATKASQIYDDKLIQNGRINVPFEKGKSAKYYVEEYAAGTSKRGKNRLITVQYPSGKVKKTKSVLFFRDYPEIESGTIIYVGSTRDGKKEGEADDEKKNDVNWSKVFADSIAQATTILTLILLVQRID